MLPERAKKRRFGVRGEQMEISSEEELAAPAKPNILVTGTPGTGKSATCEWVAERCDLRRLCVGEVVKAHGFHEGTDEYGAYIIDEDPLLDWMEEALKGGGVIVEHHGCDLFPERWFQAVIVLTTDNTLLYDRLAERKYPPGKIQSNVECEIMQVIVEEAYDSYKKEIIHVRPSNTVEQLSENAAFIVQLNSQLNSK